MHTIRFVTDKDHPITERLHLLRKLDCKNREMVTLFSKKRKAKLEKSIAEAEAMRQSIKNDFREAFPEYKDCEIKIVYILFKTTHRYIFELKLPYVD